MVYMLIVVISVLLLFSPYKLADDIFVESRSDHYANMSVQYTAIFHGYKNDYFQMKNCNIFLIFALNIDCGYTLEPPC